MEAVVPELRQQEQDGNCLQISGLRQGATDMGVQGAHLNPLGLFLNPLGVFLRTSIPFI
jgi:hypothetical protein